MMKKSPAMMPPKAAMPKAPMQAPAPEKPMKAGLPDFMQRAKRPGGMKKGGAVAMPKGMKSMMKGKR